MNGPLFQSPFKTLSYPTEAYDWYQDRYQSVHVSRNRWFCTAWAALALALLEAFALAALAPLKTSVPFLIKEETSGAVTTVSPLSGDPSATYDEAIRKYFLGHYVIDRETYDAADLAEKYRAVDLMSAVSERRIFDQWIASSNPVGPLAVYGSQTRRIIRIKSIAFLPGPMAQVRFTATEQRSSGAPKVSEWIATMTWRFGLAPAAEPDRLINPLGFSVTHYRIDQEVIS